jgi:branched-chain amino acid aminotransferase
MPEVPESLLLEGVKALLREDAAWMPSAAGTSLYVRPFLFATEAFLGVRPSKSCLFAVIVSPVAGYFSGPARPLRIWVEQERARAARGGIGAAKAAANYVASLQAAEEAKARGYDQVLWLDGAEHRYVEEIGTMNFFAKIAGRIVTPALEGTILAGVTLEEVFGTGTASLVAPIGELGWGGGEALQLPAPGPGALGEKLRAALGAVQRGEAPDRHGWLEAV